MGANRWREEREWPPAGGAPADVLPGSSGQRQHAGGRWRAGRTARAGTQRRRTGSSSTRAIPRPRAAARSAAIPRVFPWGPMDQRPVERRKDVLVYTTQAARSRTGSHRAGEGDAVRVDQRARHRFHGQAGGRVPGRHARNLTDGILRLRYRESLEKPRAGRAGRNLPDRHRCRA